MRLQLTNDLVQDPSLVHNGILMEGERMGEREGGREREEERYRGEDSEGGNTLPIYNGIKYVHTCTAIGNDRASNVLTMDILLRYSSLPHNQLYYTRGEHQ